MTMTRFIKQALAVTLAAALLVTGGVWTLGGSQQAEAQQSIRYWWQLVNERGRPYPQGTAVCSVWRAASGNNPEFHLYTTVSLATHGTSPLLGDNNGVFEFFSLEDTVVNVICWTKAGDRAIANRLDKFTHTLVIDRSGTRKVTRIEWHTNATTINTGVYIPSGAVIRDVIVQNVNLLPINAQTLHLEVGFRGDHVVSGNVGGVVSPMVIDGAPNGPQWLFPTRHIDATVNTGLLGSSPTSNLRPHLGTALILHTTPQFGGRMYQPYLVHLTGGLELTYRTSAAANARGHFFVIWEMFHVGANAWDDDQ